MIRRLGIIPAFFLVSCASERAVTFHVTAFDTEEKAVTCAVFADDEVLRNAETQEYLRTPTDVVIPFQEKAEGRGFESVKLGVRAVEVNADGSIRLPARDESPYIEDQRSVYPNDAKKQTFFLRKNRLRS